MNEGGGGGAMEGGGGMNISPPTKSGTDRADPLDNRSPLTTKNKRQTNDPNQRMYSIVIAIVIVYISKQ